MLPIEVVITENGREVFRGQFHTIDNCRRDCIQFIRTHYASEVFKEFIETNPVSQDLTETYDVKCGLGHIVERESE